MTIPAIPPARADLIDPRTGKIRHEWYLFLLSARQELDTAIDVTDSEFTQSAMMTFPGQQVGQRFPDEQQALLWM